MTNIAGYYSYTVNYNTTTTITPKHDIYPTFNPNDILINAISTDTPNQNFIGNIMTFQIVASVDQGGLVTPEGTSTIDYGKDLTIYFSSMEGFHRGEIFVDNKSIGLKSSYKFNNIKADHTIHGNFIKNIAPVITSFSSTDTAGNAQLPVTFRIEANDPDGGVIVNYKLLIEGSHSFQLDSSNPDIDFNFIFPGIYKVKVQVTDDEGEVSESDSIEINISKPAPIAIPTTTIFSKQFKNVENILNFQTYLINPLESQGILTLKAYDNNGNLVQTTNEELKGFSKTTISTQQFENIEYSQLVASFNQYAIVVTEIENTNAKMCSYLKSPLKNYLTMSHIAEEVVSWDTYAYLSNNKRAILNLSIANNKTELSGNFSYLFNLEKYFPENNEENQLWGLLENRYIDPFSDTKKLTGFEMFIKTDSDGAAVELSSRGYKKLFIPHIPVETDLFWTGFTFLNPSTTPVIATATLYNDNGEIIGIYPFEIPAKSKIKGVIEELFEDAQGLATWGTIETNDNSLTGLEIYGTFHEGICGFSLNGNTFTNGILPLVNVSKTTWTGLSITNPSSLDTEITIQLMSKNGIVLDVETRIIPAKCKISGILKKDFFANSEIDTSQYIKFSSTFGVIAIEVSGDLTRSWMKAIGAAN